MFSVLFLSLATMSAELPVVPLTALHKQQISAAVKAKLKDPDSAQFRWPAPKEWGSYCGWVNAKNSYGGYTGFKPFYVVGGAPNAKKGFIVSTVVLAEEGSAGVAEQMCSKEGYDVSEPPAR